MEKKVINFMHAHRLVEKNKTIVIGVSGGPDSMALLHFFNGIKKEWNLKIIAISVDHQLRGDESAADIEYVGEVCRKWGIPFQYAAVDVNAYKNKHKVSTQVAARKLRYDVFKKKLVDYRADYLALGHHGDDQIETMIMSLARTTNLRTLTGIPIQRKFANGHIIRPFLCVTKKEIEQYCKLYNIQPRIDFSNFDTYYTRNDIRNSIVPKLKERNENLHTTIQMLSETLQEDERYLITEAKKLVSKAITIHVKRKTADLTVSTFNQYPVALQRRAYHLTLCYLYDILPEQLTYTHEQIFLSLVHKNSNRRLDFPKDLIVERSYDHVLFYFKSSQQEDETFHKIIEYIPTSIALSDGAILSISYIDEPIAEKEENNYTYICALNQLTLPLHIRTRSPGDRMRYRGLEGSKKIKDIFIDEKIPRLLRDKTYLLTDDTNEIFWLIGIKKGVLTKKAERGPYLLFEYKKKIIGEEEDAKRY